MSAARRSRARIPEQRLDALPDAVRTVTRRPYLRTAVLGSGAAVAAFAVGSLTPHISAVVAAITALIGLRPTFHASAQEGFRQVAGVLLGASVAGALVTVFGFTPVTFFVMVLVGYVVAWWLKLGEEGAVTIGVTVILVLSNLSTEAVESRLLGVLVGALIAMAFSFFARPGRPTDRVLDELLSVSQQMAGLLTRIATDLLTAKGAVARSSAESWLHASDASVRRLVTIRSSAEDALAGARWSPWVDRAQAREVLRQVMVVRQFALTVTAICRDLGDAARSGTTLPEPIAIAFADSLTAAALALEQQAQAAMENPAELLASDSDAVRALKVSRELVIKQMRTLDDTRPILLSGSLAQDAEQLGRIISSD